MLLRALRGIFSYKKKSIPTVPVEKQGYVINNKIIEVDNLSEYFLIDIEKEYSFLELFMTFSLLKNNLFIQNYTLLICCTSEFHQQIKYILSLLFLNKFIFIDDYNFYKEDLLNIYIDGNLKIDTNKLLYYNINNHFKHNLSIDLLKLYQKYITSLTLNTDLINLLIIKIIKNIPQDNLVIFDFNNNHLVDQFKINSLIELNKNKNFLVLTSHKNVYLNVFPDNTIFIDIDAIIKKSIYKDEQFLKFLIFNRNAHIITNNSYDLLLLMDIHKKIYQYDSNYTFLYSNDTNYDYISLANNNINLTYEFSNDILSKPLNIAFFTRVTRLQNLDIIYNNITEICQNNYVNYTWFLLIPPHKIFKDLKEKFKDNKNIIIIDDYISYNNLDKYDSYLLNIALAHKKLITCQFLYVLDDDNLIHPNLINIIRKNLDKYIIINRLELSSAQLSQNHPLTIEAPLDLSKYNCLGKVDFANCVFNINALKAIGGFNLSEGSAFSDGATVLSFINAGVELIYSNELGGYYNKLIKEN